jgi:hypothetical protein
MTRASNPYKSGAMFKAREDYATDLVDIGAKPLDMYDYYYRKEPADMWSGRMDGMLAGFHAGDTLILQLPFFVRPLNLKYITEQIQQVYHGKVIGMVHDYEPLRQRGLAIHDKNSDGWLDQYSYKTYKLLFPMMDALIVHSHAFKDAIQKDLNYKKPIIVQGPFGYHFTNAANIGAPKFEKKLIFAGSLPKAQYLKHVPADWQLEVYGTAPAKEMLALKQVDYRGSFSPEQLPNEFTGGFGLVWDSTTFPTVTGELGEYTKLAYEHKLSLYLARRIPVIVWDESAPAQWVVKNHLGFAVHDLTEVAPLINRLTKKDYDKLQSNLSRVARLIQRGDYVKTAAMTAYMAVNEQNHQY